MNNGIRITGNKPRNFEPRSLETNKQKMPWQKYQSLPKNVDEHQYERGQNQNENNTHQKIKWDEHEYQMHPQRR